MMPLLQGKSLAVVLRLIHSSVMYLLLTVEGMVLPLLIWQKHSIWIYGCLSLSRWERLLLQFFPNSD